MAERLNKKILCFVDEHGTAGAGDLYLGAVFVFAREAGGIDKRFSDLLPASAKEIRAGDLDDRAACGRCRPRAIRDPIREGNDTTACLWRGHRLHGRCIYGHPVVGDIRLIPRIES